MSLNSKCYIPKYIAYQIFRVINGEFVCKFLAIIFFFVCLFDYCITENESVTHSVTLCDPMDSSSSGSAVHGILQARMLKWIAIPFSR